MMENGKTLSSPTLERGVYTLANDVVIEWFHAFIRSFRNTNPNLPLTVIPYNSSISQLQALAPKYAFKIMEESKCSHFDALESVVMGQNRFAAMFRKWACFFGDYDNFIFLDADIVVTHSLDEILADYSASSYDLLYFDVDISVVYTPEAAPQMVAQYAAVGFNAGAFVSRRGTISQEELEVASRRAAADRRKLIADQVDQPFLNYVFDTSRKNIASISQLFPSFAPVLTARQPFTYDRNIDLPRNSQGKIMPFIHWPGCAYPTMVRPEVFLRHRMNGYSPITRMRYRATFYFQRYRTYFLKKKAHWRKVILQFLTSRAWRKFYLYKLIGIKAKLPE